MPALLEIDRLKIDARGDDGGLTPIVKGVSFSVKRGEVVALIGESGSGKTTIALSALGYAKPGLEFTGGEVRLDGRDVISMPPDEQRALRGQRVAYLAQSAAATFNPALTIGEQVTESPVLHGQLSREQADLRAEELYRALELPDPDRLGKRYPHQVSGGQLQRLMAAMALCGKPDLLILDEPTTALDVTTQIEVLKAFKSVIRQEGSAAIYVTHDLSVVAQIADHIVVLYAGDVQEHGTADKVINRPSHDYTRRLMAAVRPPPAAGQGDESSDAHERDAPALEVKNVTAGYGKGRNGAPSLKVLRDINVAVQRGHTVGGDRRIRLRQVHAGAGHVRPAARERRGGPAGRRQAATQPPPARPRRVAEGAVRLPDGGHRVEPAPADRPHSRPPDRVLPRAEGRGEAQAHRRVAPHGRAAAGVRRALPGGALRGAEAARESCTCARGPPPRCCSATRSSRRWTPSSAPT